VDNDPRMQDAGRFGAPEPEAQPADTGRTSAPDDTARIEPPSRFDQTFPYRPVTDAAEPGPPVLPSAPNPEGRRASKTVLVPILAALVGSAIGTGATLVATDNRPARETAVVREGVRPAAQAELTGVAAIAKSVMPSIVLIEITGDRGFLGQVQGNGSGVIYRSDGYIITNNHVIAGATDITVRLPNNVSLPARVIGTAAPSDDIAVIKVDKAGLTPAVLGSIADTNVGDLAIAIGSPFGLQGTVTAGVVSAVHRNINLGGGERITDAIQTDAPINPGNSGGGLVNGRGQVIGINTAIVGGTGGNVGVGFAIPIDIARRDADQIIKTGRAERPFLGITGESLPNEGGAVLQGVEPGGPAASAGLKADDIIVLIDGDKIGSMDDLISVLSRHSVGETVSVTYVRGGERHTVKVKLAARPTG
jgi:putative serine protease PepD